MLLKVLHALGIVVMLLSGACLFRAAWAWIEALGNRPSNVGLMDPNLWTRLTADGIRLRDIGFRFFFGGAALFGVGWLLL